MDELEIELKGLAWRYKLLIVYSICLLKAHFSLESLAYLKKNCYTLREVSYIITVL